MSNGDARVDDLRGPTDGVLIGEGIANMAGVGGIGTNSGAAGFNELHTTDADADADVASMHPVSVASANSLETASDSASSP